MNARKCLLCAVAVLAALGTEVQAFEGINGEYRPGFYSTSPNAIGDIKGEYRPGFQRNSWNTIGDIKGEFAPSEQVVPSSPYDGPDAPWFEFLDFWLGY